MSRELIRKAKFDAQEAVRTIPLQGLLVLRLAEIIDGIGTALEAAEAKLAKTSDALRIERQGFNERMAAIEKAHRILGMAVRDGIHPNLVEAKVISAKAKAEGPTREKVESWMHVVAEAAAYDGTSKIDQAMADLYGEDEGMSRLFPQEQENKA